MVVVSDVSPIASTHSVTVLREMVGFLSGDVGTDTATTR